MFYPSLPTDFGLRTDQTSLTLHNCLHALGGSGAMPVAKSLCRAEVGL